MRAPRSIRRPGLTAALATAALGGVALTGCDLQEDADLTRGRQLFIAKCGSCHVLAQAATTGTQGPDLDASFAQARATGMDQDTIEGVVESQIANPRPSVTDMPEVSMPADLVQGEDMEDVSAYVASVAGIPGIRPPEAPGGPGGQIFADNGCGGCHTLALAQATGTTGPDLDDVLPGQSAAHIEEQIVDPDSEITQGYQAGTMPDDFEQSISPEDLRLLVQFLLESAGETQG